MDELRPSPSAAANDRQFREEWHSFYMERRRSLIHLFWFAGGLALFTLLLVVTRDDRHSPLIIRIAIAFSLGLLLIACLAQWFFFVWQMATWPCPRCAKRFFFSAFAFDPFFSRRCKHCGLLRLKDGQT
jgi:type IV secretory pathway VirB3-like protein